MTDTMPPKLTPRLEALMFLRDVVIPHMRQPDCKVVWHSYEVSYDASGHGCGTYRCLLGWYNYLRYNRPFPTENECFKFPEFNLNYFDLGDDYDKFFGFEAASGSLDDRAKRVDEEIEKEIRALVQTT